MSCTTSIIKSQRTEITNKRSFRKERFIIIEFSWQTRRSTNANKFQQPRVRGKPSTQTQHRQQNYQSVTLVLEAYGLTVLENALLKANHVKTVSSTIILLEFVTQETGNKRKMLHMRYRTVLKIYGTLTVTMMIRGQIIKNTASIYVRPKVRNKPNISFILR